MYMITSKIRKLNEKCRFSVMARIFCATGIVSWYILLFTKLSLVIPDIILRWMIFINPIVTMLFGMITVIFIPDRHDKAISITCIIISVAIYTYLFWQIIDGIGC